MIGEVRGWGAIQHLFTDQKQAADFQDAMGKFFADAINEKLNQSTPSEEQIKQDAEREYPMPENKIKQWKIRALDFRNYKIAAHIKAASKYSKPRNQY